jgi:hypothetical protein
MSSKMVTVQSIKSMMLVGLLKNEDYERNRMAAVMTINAVTTNLRISAIGFIGNVKLRLT